MNILTNDEKQEITRNGYTFSFGGEFNENTVSRKLSSGKVIRVNLLSGNHCEIIGYQESPTFDSVWIEGGSDA